jgi:uncharacterized membrane protein
MVIMLLDHTRDFVYSGGFTRDPTDLATTTVPLFLTRWITHFCAPVFVFLAGASAWLQASRGKPPGELRGFLVKRGLWLVLLELTAVRLGSMWELDYRFFGVLQVIFAIGVSMVVLGALLPLGPRVLGATGVAIVALHNTLDGVRVPEWNGPTSPAPGVGDALWMLLHQGGAFPVAGWPSPVAFAAYPVLAWVGVMLAGYAFGTVLDRAAAVRQRLIMRLGLAMTAAFVLLRALNVYGDPDPWSVQRSAAFTVLSFLNTHKYPPSLLYLLMTLGPALVLLAWLDRRLDGGPPQGWFGRWLVTFGRVPLFYYLLQWPTAHLAGVVLAAAAGHPLAWYFENPFLAMAGNIPPPPGFPLWVVYLAWIAGLLLLTPICAWYARVKARSSPGGWLSYL